MATFAKATFDSAQYSLFRPTYPRQLFDAAFKYHERTRGARWDLAVDLGCGTGPFYGIAMLGRVTKTDVYKGKQPLN